MNFWWIVLGLVVLFVVVSEVRVRRRARRWSQRVTDEEFVRQVEALRRVAAEQRKGEAA